MSFHIGSLKQVLTHLLDRFVDRDTYMHARGGGIGHFLRGDKEQTVPIPEELSPDEHDDVELDPAYLVSDVVEESKEDEDEDIAGLSGSDESQFAESEDSEHDDWDDVGDSL